ncbi:MAG: class I SAM-dependent methyltransferase [Aggregatilineales bacterium]
MATIDEFYERVRRVTLTESAFSRLTITPNFDQNAPVSEQTGYRGLHWQRLQVHRVQFRSGIRWQFSYFTARQNVTKNYDVDEAAAHLDAALVWPIRSIRLETNSDDWQLQIGKRGTPIVHHHAVQTPVDPVPGHDHDKAVPFPANQPDALLQAIGIMDSAGRVRPSMHAKFAQVNSFLTLLEQTGALETFDHSPIRLLDCGCGAAYLSLAAYHYLTEKRGIAATLTGIDYNGALIDEDNLIVSGLGYSEACFFTSAIATYTPDVPPDVLLALHACDTASDDALALGIRCGARVILCAPCCHRQLRSELHPVAPFEPVVRHGILEKRLADLLTDSFRALILRLMGYKTDVVEFVAPEHTDKNVLIRAVAGLPSGDPAIAAEYRALKEFWGVTPYLERLLGEVENFTSQND